MNVTAIIIDDKERFRNILIKTLKEIPHNVNVLASCATANEGKEAIARLMPDIVFLDVEMPGKNGFEMLEEIGDINFDIIFTTSYNHYAIRAIKASAFDFLLKPVSSSDLEETLARFMHKKGKELVLRQLEVLMQHYEGRKEINKKIALPTPSGMEFVSVDQIVRLQAESNYTNVFVLPKMKFTVAKTLKDMEELLSGSSFIRVHQSHLINRSFIKRYNKDDNSIEMEDGSKVELAVARKSEFLSLFKKTH